MKTTLRIATLAAALAAVSPIWAQNTAVAEAAKEPGAVVTSSGLVYRSLKDGTEAIEERARSELGLVKPGEQFYQVVEPMPAGKADGNGKR